MFNGSSPGTGVGGRSQWTICVGRRHLPAPTAPGGGGGGNTYRGGGGGQHLQGGGVLMCDQGVPTGDWPVIRPKEVHAGQGLKVGLYTPTILGGNSYLSWFYDRGAITDPAHTGTSKGLSQAINRGPIRKFLPKYATMQCRGLSAGARTHYVTANVVRNGLAGDGREY